MTFLVGCYVTCTSFLMSFVGSFPSAGFTGAFVYSRGIPLRVPSGLGRGNRSSIRPRHFLLR